MSFEIPGRPARAVLFLIAVILAMVACSREHAATAPSTIALVSDPTALDNALARCNQSSASVEAAECRSVRAALARLADDRRKLDAEKQRRAQAEAELKFEQERQALRRKLDAEKARRESDAQKPDDPYNMPFVPPESPGKSPTPAAQPAPESAPTAKVSGDKIVASTSDDLMARQ